MSRIFLSHSSKDNVAAVALADWLKEEGWDDTFLDLDPVQGIHPGERWERALYTHAADCEAVLFLVSRKWLDSEWCKREFDLARKLNKRCFVILIERISIDELPLFLKETHQTVSLATGEDHKVFRPKLPITHEEGYITFSTEGLARLKIGLERAGLDPRFFAWPPANEPQRAPYRGLEALDGIDAGIFFGRDGPIIEALDRLRGLRDATPPRLFVILGASGAGKSSFLRAGLLPRLARDDRNFVILPVIRPERAAISGPSGLIASIADAIMQRGLTTTRARVRQAIAEGAGALRPILKTLLTHTDEEKPPTIVLTIDQAEELFRAEAAEEAEQLLALLSALMAVDDPSTLVIFVIRSDSYDALQRCKAFEGLKQDTFALLPMPHGAYQTVIEGPLKRLRLSGRKFEIEPGLTEALLEDIEQGGGSDALPLLSFTLELLYRDHEAARHISRDDYLDFGGLKGAINAALKRAFTAADLDPRIPKDYEARLALLRRGFIPWLAGVDPETRSLRRRVAHAAQIPEEARPLIDLLVEQRLLTRDVDKETGEATVEPAHEALLRQWGGLKGWLEEDFGRLAALEGVKRAAMDWDANARNAAWLAHGGGRLSEADQLDLRPDLSALLNGTDRAYLAACRQKEKQTREDEEEKRRAEAELVQEKQERLQQRARDMKIVASLLSGGVVLSLALAAWAFHERDTAEKQIEAATKTSNDLIRDIVGNIKSISGVPTSTVLHTLDIAHQLQEDLTKSGYRNVELQRSHALSREETAPICLQFGDLPCALDAAEEAIQLRTAVLKTDPDNPVKRLDLARAQTRMGDVKKELGALAEAESLYASSLAAQDAVAPPESNRLEWLRDRATNQEGIGDVLRMQGKPEEAHQYYRAAQAERETILHAEPNKAEWLRDSAGNDQKMGEALFDRNERRSAQKSFDRATSKIASLVEKNPNNSEFKEELAASREKIGDIQLGMNKLDPALASFEQSFAVMNALVATDTAKARWQRQLAGIQNKLGDVHLAKGELDAAEKSYSDALARIEQVARKDKANAILQIDWSRSLSKMGDVRLIKGQLPEALRYYRESLEKLAQNPLLDSKDQRRRLDVARLNEFIGSILYNQKDYAGATAAFEQMLEALESVSRADPNNAELQLRIVETLKQLALVDDRANIEKHIKSAEAILDHLSAKTPEDDADQRRLLDYEKTQLSNGRIDLYNLVGAHARLTENAAHDDANKTVSKR